MRSTVDPGLVLLAIVGVVSLGILAWTGRKRFPLRIGVGNFFRRKTQVAIVVAGLLIGTSIITSSYVIQSTFDYTIRSAVFRALDHVDETVYVLAPSGDRQPFPIGAFDALYANRSAMPNVDALAPRVQLSGAVIDTSSGLFEPSANVVGFDATYEPGSFVRGDGTSWDGSGLSPGHVILNQKLAVELEAKAGDSLVLAMAGPRGPVQLGVTVEAVVQDAGMGAWGDDVNVFLALGDLQGGLGMPGQINLIIVSNVGGVADGYLRSDDAVLEVKAHLPPPPTFTVSKLKADEVDAATTNVRQLSQLFALLGVFTVVAGILLIVNIFVMLAEERKGEMGVARALGMRRRNLVQSFVAEGLLYALASAAVGTLAGLLVAGVILWAFGQIFPPEAFGGVRFVLTWTNLDLISGFAIGFMITMATIVLASWRVSKLNIVRAIRDIPEPVEHRSTRRQIALGAFLAGIGAVGTISALVTRNLYLQDLGPTSLALGLAVLTMRVLSPRAVYTAAGAFIIGWLLSPWKFFSTANAEIALFILVGLLLIFGGLLVVMFNSDTVLAIATRAFRRRTWRPVVRTAIAYPMNKKFRTGVTLASIALIMFTIATMSCIQSLVASSIETTTVRQGGGFNLVAASRTGIPDWNRAFSNYTGSANFTEARPLSQVPLRVSRDPLPNGTTMASALLGVPPEWAEPPFEVQVMDPVYRDRAAMWAAVHADPHLAVIDGSVIPQNFGPNFGTFSAQVGDVFYYRNVTGSIESLRVVGILYETFVRGFFMSWDAVRTDFGVSASTLFYLKTRPAVDVTAASHDLERHFVQYQMVTVNIRSVIDQILEVTMGIFNLLQAYLALGLVVGIAGLGVITMRNVVERRQETGALRALGFRKSMVLRSFLFELSFIALTGIAMGTILGIALSYDLYLVFFEGQAVFGIPWVRLLVLGGIAFLGAVLSTASPAIRASRMPPAEALRRLE